MASNTKEKRKDPRVPAILVMDVHAPNAKLQRAKGVLLDLSLGGLGFESETEFEKGTEVVLTVNMPVEVQGRIVHADTSGPLRKYGVKFTQLGKAERSHVEKFVAIRFKK